ncbi:MAG: helix-turn-helix transcriptional regulator [Thermoanaerobaculia bacterium]
MERNAIAENILKLREERHWTQEELAAASGVDVRTIQRAEAGSPLLLETLKSLASAFNTSVDDLSASEKDIEKKLAEFRNRYTLIPMQRVDNGADLGGLLGTSAYHFNKFGQFTEEQADEISMFEQEVFDWGEIWDEFGPAQRREAEKSLNDSIARLRAADLSASASVKRKRLRPRDGGEPLEMSFLYVPVVSGKTPLLYLVEEKGLPISFK